MFYETAFQWMNAVVLPFWVLMIALPNWRWTRRVLGSLLVIVPPALVYVVLLFTQMPTVGQDLANLSLTTVATLLGTPAGAALGWAHFLTFDLFVGRWVYLDSRRRHLTPLGMAPILLLVFLLGPVGFLVYVALRALLTKDGDGGVGGHDGKPEGDFAGHGR